MPTPRETDAAVIRLAAEMPHGMVNAQTALRVLTELREARNRIAELETQLNTALDAANQR